MTTRTTTTSSDEPRTTSLDESQVTAFLRENPDFLVRNPDLLGELQVPHDPGKGAVSLIEHQVAVLRQRNETLDQRLATLLRNARDNERVGTRLLGLGRGLLEADSLDAVLSLVRDALLTEFSADTVVIRLIDHEGSAGVVESGARFLAPDAPELVPVSDCLDKGEPCCGLTDAQDLQTLLPGNDPLPRSAAVVPLCAGRPLGLIVLGSHDPGHFHPDMGTLFLSQLGDLVTTGVARHIGDRR